MELCIAALFRWGAALQHRSRLRPRNSSEKVKLLQQARCLYEDALHMDSENPQLQDALSSFGNVHFLSCSPRSVKLSVFLTAIVEFFLCETVKELWKHRAIKE
ncbi:unnamed protein product [Fraxinus pennsylvanica]|uniref:Uncharacterized protein n=1 Tax=Fraxinus pennsylvanica TaxID=56036 RepID=A0AAD2A957_9LAMI|nr:unnamed protein product [Fraxinus pennsylvanica]